MLRAYPRTAWWLADKGKGDELDIITRPTPDRPEAFRRVVEEVTGGLKDCQGAVPTSDGEEKHMTFYVRDRLPEATDKTIRNVLTGLFGAKF
ncbi:MAG: hypothetical protein ACYC3V_20105 [Chloroflexota bacterium]